MAEIAPGPPIEDEQQPDGMAKDTLSGEAAAGHCSIPDFSGISGTVPNQLREWRVNASTWINVYPQNDQNVVTLGGSGFGVMAILAGINRGFISREEALIRFQKIVTYLKKADRFHGAWPHWLQGETGKVKPFSKYDDGGDLVETAFMIQGLLTVAEYFKAGNEAERQLVADINQLWEEVEWDWYTRGEDVLYWHWSPNYGWKMNFPVGGYNECLIMYVLAASSPTHPIDPAVYHKGWARNGNIANDTVYYGLHTVLNFYEHNDDPTGPLFWAHYSFLGLDPRGLQDQYADYWKLNQNQAMIHYKYALDNPKGFKGYGENQWGMTSSYSIKGYAGHHPGDSDLGVISPTAALSSFPYTPQQSMQFLEFLYNDADSLIGKYGPMMHTAWSTIGMCRGIWQLIRPHPGHDRKLPYRNALGTVYEE